MASMRKLKKQELRYVRYLNKVNRRRDPNIDWDSRAFLRNYNRMVDLEYRRRP